MTVSYCRATVAVEWQYDDLFTVLCHPIFQHSHAFKRVVKSNAHSVASACCCAVQGFATLPAARQLKLPHQPYNFLEEVCTCTQNFCLSLCEMPCRLLLLSALCCAVLCCAVLCCAVLCCAVLCCAVLCCAVLCCAVLCCAVLFPNVLCLLCHAVLCLAVLCRAVLCHAVLHHTVKCSAVRICACDIAC